MAINFIKENPMMILGAIFGGLVGSWGGAIIGGLVGLVIDEVFK